jgi:pimeloyl-ACP methyl ester carboxylesterase
MPFQRVNGVKLYYESHGEGEPLLFIPGLGGHAAETPYLTKAYSPHVRYVVYDNRGCGRSDKPDEEYSIAGFADDAAALLDALKIDRAVVYGSSMGGMVAQELVLRHPAKVRGLILGCTTAGAVRGVQPSAETIAAMVRNQSLSGDEALEAGWSLGYSAAWIAANREALFARSRAASAYAAPRESYMRQVIAAAKHDTYDRLDQITCPVMIIHGSEDVMIPPGNAGLLAQHIPHAEVHILEGLGHGYNLEGQAIADALVLDFARRVAAGEAEVHAEGSTSGVR